MRLPYMRALLVFFAVFPCLILCSCKKNGGPQLPNYNDSTEIAEAITFKIIATEPSPWDSANSPLADSFTINQVVPMGEYISGISFGLVNPPNSGITLAYSTNNQPFFILSLAAMPTVSSNFLLNQTYSYTSAQNFPAAPIFLSMGGDDTGPGRYFKDTVPPDGSSQPVTTTTYSQVIFTNKDSSNQLGNNSLIYFADGVISGYEILSYGMSDPNKYIQRWDFEISFKNLTYQLLP
jgi:hypothetical protein